MAVAKADEHVLGLNAPIVEDGPFDAAAKCPGRNCIAGVSGCDNPVAAAAVSASFNIFVWKTTFDGFQSAATCTIPGMTSLSNSNDFPTTSDV